MQKTLEQSDWAVLQKTAVCNTINANHATKVMSWTDKQEMVAQNWRRLQCKLDAQTCKKMQVW